MVSAQWTSLRSTFGPPLLVAALGSGLAVGLGVWIHNSRRYGRYDAFGASVFGLLGVGGVLLIQALDFLGIAWLGMWLAFCYAWFVGFILDIILIAVFASKLNSDVRQTLTSRPQLLAATPK